MNRRSAFLSRAFFLAGGLLVLWMTFVRTGPPDSISGEGKDGDGSVERIMADVKEITRKPRPMGSPEINRVRNYLIDRLEKMKISPNLQEETVPDYFDVVPDSDRATMVNILARLPGTRPTKAVALMGHYDSVPQTPGANDNASAVACLLETVRLIQNGPPLENDVILILTDGEEPAPRYGSSAFVQRHPWFRDIGLVVNLDALGATGPSTLLETGGDNFQLVREFRKAVPFPVAFSYTYDILRRIPDNPTDFGPFLKAEIPGYNLAYSQESMIYHTPLDRADRIDPRSLSHHGSNALSLARHFGHFDFSREDFSGPGEAVYFSIWRRFLIAYPQAWARLLLLIATLGLGILFAFLWRTGPRPLSRVGRGICLQLAYILASLVSTGFAWWLIVGFRLDSWLWGMALAGLVFALSKSVLAIKWSRNGIPAVLEGGLFWWWFFCLVATFLLPGWSCLFLWPLLIALGGIALVRFGLNKLSRTFPREGVALAVASAMILILLPVVVDFYHLAQPRPGNPDSQTIQIIVLPALFLSLFFGIVGPLGKIFSVRQSGQEKTRLREFKKKEMIL